MKAKILNILVILASFMGYLEWGEEYNMFLIQLEIDVISKLINNPLSVLHPFTILPLLGQALLIITLFQKSPGRVLTYAGIFGIGILFLVLLVVGLVVPNIKVALSTFPFLIVASMAIWHHQSTSRRVVSRIN